MPVTNQFGPDHWLDEIDDAEFEDQDVPGHSFDPGPDGIVLNEQQSILLRQVMAGPPRPAAFPVRFLPLREVRP